MNLGMKVIVCPTCGAKFHGWDEASATENYSKHKCLTTKSDDDISKILDDILEELK
jgi:hypothetical protein